MKMNLLYLQTGCLANVHFPDIPLTARSPVLFSCVMCFIAMSALLQADFPIRETIPDLDLKAFYTVGYNLNPLRLAK